MICRAIPYEGKEPYIFMSYCHKDKAKLYPFFEQVVLGGYRIWYDDGNHAGDDWLDNIESHLEDAKVVVAFISADSSLSHNCKSEIVYALKCNKKVIPVLIDNAELPKGLRMQLSHLHYLRCSDYPGDAALIAKLCETAEFTACKAPAGSLRLKPDAVPQKEQPPKNEPAPVQKKERTPAFDIKNFVLKDLSKPEPEPENNSYADLGDEADNHTVFECDPGDMTVCDGYESDADATVRVVNQIPAVLLHPAAEKAYILKKPQTIIGRSPIKCDIVIEGNKSISKLHAEILQYNQKYFLKDSGSSNGTFIKGEAIESGKHIQLETPALFRLNDEALILVTGAQARKILDNGFAALLMNGSSGAVKLLESETLPLNRNSKWPDGTLADVKIHRAAHALVRRSGDAFHLVDESPEGGNGSYLNGSKLARGTSAQLKCGDQIRLGSTTLTFVHITI